MPTFVRAHAWDRGLGAGTHVRRRGYRRETINVDVRISDFKIFVPSLCGLCSEGGGRDELGG